MNFSIREIKQDDIPFLWEMLYQSMYVSERHKPFPREILKEPAIAKYVSEWGRDGDIGLLAEINNKPIGAVWLRLFEESNKGFGYVDDATPEMGIAMIEEYRGKGIGRGLMNEIEKRAKAYGYQQISLSVDPDNPARRLYEKFGYTHVGWCDTSWTMKKELKNKEKLPIVIAIAAVSGGGKTAVTTDLNRKLQNSKALFFDDYDFDGPDDIINWVDHGADYDLWNLTPLMKDIEKLLTEPLNFILLDYPFAYKNSMMSQYIDLAVFIDTPLDIAMARRLTRDFKNRTADDILIDLENYVSNGRRGYTEMLTTIQPNSDIVVDGTLNISEIVKIISEKISIRGW